jgi:hypothetical protein
MYEECRSLGRPVDRFHFAQAQQPNRQPLLRRRIFDDCFHHNQPRSEAICCLSNVMLSYPNTTVPGSNDFHLYFEANISLSMTLGHRVLKQSDSKTSTLS